MDRRQVKHLFNRYVNGECTEREIEVLNAYLDSFQKKSSLIEDLDFDNEIKEKLWAKINRGIKAGKKYKVLDLIPNVKYAAVFILLFGCSIWYILHKTPVVQQLPLVNDRAVVLKTSDSESIKIDYDDDDFVLNKNGEKLVSYSKGMIKYKDNNEVKSLIFNEIIVPDGKTFRLTLSDGSKVHLNAGSSIKFPVNFLSGYHRQVFLNGEAYFEVTRNETSPFIVSTDRIGVRVLGTSFNVNSYKGFSSYAVLEEGKVEVFLEDGINKNSVIIQPGEKASLEEQLLRIDEVDLEDYLGWRDGMLSFNNESFDIILKKIERYYGVSINNQYKELGKIRFRGSFKDETITELLDTFKESAGFDYSVINNKVTIETMNSKPN